MIHVRIDLYSRNMTLVAVNDNGKLLAEDKLANTPANLSRFFEPITDSVQALFECIPKAFGILDS